MRKFLIIAALLFGMEARAERMDLDCEDHMDDDTVSLACNIYWEGRNQGLEGMMAIAAVTLWRVQDPRFPDNVADVVWEKRWSQRHERYYAQFSWTLDGKKDFPFANEKTQWDNAFLIARMFTVNASRKAEMCPEIAATERMWDILEEQGTPVTRRPVQCEAYDTLMRSKLAILEDVDNTGGAVFYHADYVDPYWASRLIKKGYTTIKVGTHIFYRKEEIES